MLGVVPTPSFKSLRKESAADFDRPPRLSFFVSAELFPGSTALLALTRPLPACGAQYSKTGIEHAFSTRCLSFSASSTYRLPADIEFCPVQVGHEVLVRIEIFGKGGKFVAALLLLGSDRKPDREKAEGNFVQVKKGRRAFVYRLNHKARREVCFHSFVL
jgi:hypothetical protein